MTALDFYHRLGAKARADRLDAFDLHIILSILAIGFEEAAAEGKSVSRATGLSAVDLDILAAEVLPGLAALTPKGEGTVARGDDEACLLDLLGRCTSRGTPFQSMLAAMIARRAQRPNHLWQDLGLADRGELSLLMARHFPALAQRNEHNMKWKKFLYRTICRDTGYSLCTAPSCSECGEFDVCFGAEDGESRLAQLRRSAEFSAEI